MRGSMRMALWESGLHHDRVKADAATMRRLESKTRKALAARDRALEELGAQRDELALLRAQAERAAELEARAERAEAALAQVRTLNAALLDKVRLLDATMRSLGERAALIVYVFLRAR